MFSSKVLGWLAIIATVCFIALAALQVVELSFYRDAWPPGP
jgi:hypothetical protein